MNKFSSRAIIIRNNQLLVMERQKGGNHYYTLVGGGIEKGETKEQALIREVKEETNLDIKYYKHVFTEQQGGFFGTQYIFLCRDVVGDPSLQDDSDEAKISMRGEQIYNPVWLRVSLLKDYNLLSPKIKSAIINAVKNTFPDIPVML